MIHQHPRKRRILLAVLISFAGGLLVLTLYKQRMSGNSTVPDRAVDIHSAGIHGPVASNVDLADARVATVRASRPGIVAGSSREEIRQSMAARKQASDDQARRNAGIKAAMAAAYLGEQPDTVWAAKTEKAMQDAAYGEAMASAGIKPASFDIDCKRTICRMSSSFASSAEADDWVMLYMASIGGVAQSSMVSRTANPDGTIGIEIYSAAK